MADIIQKIKVETTYIQTSLRRLDLALKQKKLNELELIGTAASLHDIYGGIENILKQIFKDQGITIPTTPDWHKELLKTAVSNNLISSKLAQELSEYLGFRHFFIHAYGFMIKQEKVLELAKPISKIWADFLSCINKLYKI